MSSLVLVIGATGKVGSRVVKELAESGVNCRAATRRPEEARRWLPPGVEAVEFDYERPETFRPALDGADRLFLSVRPGDDDSDLTAIPLVEEAVGRGVRHIVSLTAMGVDRIADNSLRRIERRVETSGASWTHVRPNFFMQIFAVPPLGADLQAGGTLQLPAADARVSYIHVRDVAAVAVRGLLDPVHAGRAYTLTGSEALDHHEVVGALSRASGLTLRYVPLSEGEARRRMAAAGLDCRRIERLIRFYALVRAGACSLVSPDVAQVLERPPIAFSTFAREWRPAPEGRPPTP